MTSSLFNFVRSITKLIHSCPELISHAKRTNDFELIMLAGLEVIVDSNFTFLSISQPHYALRFYISSVNCVIIRLPFKLIRVFTNVDLETLFTFRGTSNLRKHLFTNPKTLFQMTLLCRKFSLDTLNFPSILAPSRHIFGPHPSSHYYDRE